ncbi:sodium:solute symporter [Allobacillus sp. GCM10007491]|uniref:Sodium:solute symporter family protein n=2 Tax=Allobacillus TaxID=1400133 RepID=A0A941CWX4_9BACI|nr:MULTISPECIES: sodium:solute symporter family protein [Allobacillus]MBR7553908.1 sodium:solute symporter family protein [Allobacillus saliphilus]MBU6080817.1 sodium:solute symporter family protein [Allobacillus halotolerans]
MFNGEERIILTVTVFVYFIFLFVLALYMNRKTKTYEDYNVAGRSVGLFPIMLTFIGTGVGGSTLLGYMENGYRLGMGEQWINITMLFSIIIFASFLLKRVRKLGEVHNMVTLGDYTALRYGEKARIPTVISVLFSYCAMTGMQFVAIGTILNLIIGLDMTLGIVLGWLILTLKTYLGGLKAVIWQDVFHGTIQTLGIVILFVVVVVAAGGWELIAENARSMNEESMISILNIETSEIFVYLLTLGVYQFIRQDLWQRVWAAKSMETARNGYWISMIIAIGLAALVVAIGVFSRYGLNLEGVDPALIYYGVIGELFPFSLVVVMIVVLLATVISSADSFFIAGSSSIANDLIRPNVKQSDNKKMLAYSKISVLIVSVIALVFSLAIPGLVNLMVTGTAMSVSGLLAPVLFGLFWKRVTKLAGLASMWGGLLTAVIWQVLGHPFGLHPIFIGLPISIGILLVVTFFTKNKQQVVF